MSSTKVPTLNARIELFLEQVRVLKSLNFPSIARDCQLNWFRDLKPLLATETPFKGELQEILEEIKFDLYNAMLTTGRDGKRKNGASPEITYINAIIKHIDSGAVVGKLTHESVASSPEAEEEHRRRLGIADKPTASE